MLGRNEKCSDRMITDTFKDLVVKLLVVTLKSSVLECSSARELVNSYDWTEHGLEQFADEAAVPLVRRGCNAVQ